MPAPPIGIQPSAYSAICANSVGPARAADQHARARLLHRLRPLPARREAHELALKAATSFDQSACIASIFSRTSARRRRASTPWSLHLVDVPAVADAEHERGRRRAIERRERFASAIGSCCATSAMPVPSRSRVVAVPFEIPRPVALGKPTPEFGRPWSVYGWIDGRPVNDAAIGDLSGFARDVAYFLTELARVDSTGGPLAGSHSFHRGAHPRFYDDEVQKSLAVLDEAIDAAAARRVWDAALSTEITARPVWFHGDIAHGNLLVRGGRLSAVIDFGTSGVGDPAYDLAIAWTMFDDDARSAFREGLPGTTRSGHVGVRVGAVEGDARRRR